MFRRKPKKYRVVETHDPKRDSFRSYRVDVFNIGTDVLVTTSGWTYAADTARRRIRDNLRKIEAIKQNKEATVTTIEM